MKQQTMPELLTVDEVMKVMRLSKNATYEAIRAGQIPSIRIGRKILVPAERLKRLLSGEQEGSSHTAD